MRGQTGGKGSELDEQAEKCYNMHMEQGKTPETQINSLGAALTRKITDMMRHPINEVPETEVLEALFFDGPAAADKLVPPGSTQKSNFRNPVTGAKAWLEMPVPGSRPSEFEGISRWGLAIDVPIGAVSGEIVQRRYYMRIDEATYATSLKMDILGDVSENKKNELISEMQDSLVLDQDVTSGFYNGNREFSHQSYERGQHQEIMKLLNSFRPEHDISAKER